MEMVVRRTEYPTTPNMLQVLQQWQQALKRILQFFMISMLAKSPNKNCYAPNMGSNIRMARVRNPETQHTVLTP